MGFFETIHVDDHVIVLNKQAGLLSVPGIGEDKADCLANRVRQVHPTARIVHRLDRDTSGVIIMALDGLTHRALSIQFQERQTKKTYIALAHGIVDDDEGVIDLPIRKDMDNPPRQLVDFKDGRPSVTDWRVLHRDRSLHRTRLELQPITGRAHQIRLHLQRISHPILGDDLYAPPDVLKLADRLLLHATGLTVTHPGTHVRETFCAPCPF